MVNFVRLPKQPKFLVSDGRFLILRELLMGGRRFNELQRGLGDISPALLTSRLKSLEEQRLIVRRRLNGQRGHAYFPTPACDAFMPVIVSIGEWGMSFARHMLVADDFDIDFLMYYLERSIDCSRLSGDHTVIRSKFTDLKEQLLWWLLIDGNDVQICITPPGRDVDVYFTTTVRTMHDVWMGDRTYRDAVDLEDMIIEGDPALTRNVSRWLKPSVFVAAERSPVPENLRHPQMA